MSFEPDRSGPTARLTLGMKAEVRPLRTHQDCQKCVNLQRETWGVQFNEVVPATILKASQRLGGVAAGAFDDAGELLGFVFGLTGVEHGRLVHWSDMLAVRESARDHGLGQQLKAYQRELLRPLAVEMIYWTFDPLVSRNAHLNLNRLGAVVEEYIPDMYGDTGSSLHSLLGTDRLIMAWPVDDSAGGSKRGRTSAFERVAFTAAPVANTVVTKDGHAVPVELRLEAVPEVLIEIPPDIQQTKAASPEAAVAWRTTTRRAFLWYLKQGYRVAGFYREGGPSRSFYALLSDDASVRFDAQPR